MHNILKYAKATHVIVSIYVYSNNLKLVIDDNGVGFQINSSKEAIGLKNLKSRMKRLRGVIQIQAEVDKGTSIICNPLFLVYEC